MLLLGKSLRQRVERLARGDEPISFRRDRRPDWSDAPRKPTASRHCKTCPGSADLRLSQGMEASVKIERPTWEWRCCVREAERMQTSWQKNFVRPRSRTSPHSPSSRSEAALLSSPGTGRVANLGAARCSSVCPDPSAPPPGLRAEIRPKLLEVIPPNPKGVPVGGEFDEIALTVTAETSPGDWLQLQRDLRARLRTLRQSKTK